VLQHLRRDGATAPARVVTALPASRRSGYPRLASHGSDLVVAWTDVGASRVRAALVPLSVYASAPIE
jgi:hypothetical protein